MNYNYNVIDKTTKKVVGTYSTATRARAARDRKDNAYGCYQFLVVKAEV